MSKVSEKIANKNIFQYISCEDFDEIILNN